MNYKLKIINFQTKPSKSSGIKDITPKVRVQCHQNFLHTVVPEVERWETGVKRREMIDRRREAGNERWETRDGEREMGNGRWGTGEGRGDMYNVHGR